MLGSSQLAERHCATPERLIGQRGAAIGVTGRHIGLRRQRLLATSPNQSSSAHCYRLVKRGVRHHLKTPAEVQSGHRVRAETPAVGRRYRTQAVTKPPTSHARASSNAGLDPRVARRLLLAQEEAGRSVGRRGGHA